ncbi:hypothetical protein ACI7YT_12605 [Microbacterium sp. M]|uniref:hypothetical protein n=1 Tax=Microbacterium sp. M TaxID=3377125 RepID=UPI003866BF26
MSDDKITIRRRDISIYEEQAVDTHYETRPGGWYATFSGRTSTGEYISFGRRAATVKAALSDLEAEFATLGWEVTA